MCTMASCRFLSWNVSDVPETSSADALIETIRQAAATRSSLNIVGGDSKHFLGVTEAADTLCIQPYSGIINYQPTELVVTVRAGTRLQDLNTALAAEGQMLAFEPPEFGGTTIGGALATGFSGPRRPFSGSARDFMLGVRLINGHGHDLKFGGEVMKNVAGYDISRLQVGAYGTLGLLLEASLKVLPIAECECTLHHSLVTEHDVSALIKLRRQPLPLSAGMVIDRDQYIRLSGSASAVQATVRELGGEQVEDGYQLWAAVKDLRHPFFDNTRTLWRLSVSEFAPAIALNGDWLMDWCGAQRWLKTDAPAAEVFAATAAVGGHATRFASTDNPDAVFQPLTGAMRHLQKRVRDSFDPHRVFNRNRFHAEMDKAK